ncbi:unnamed protein product, partial [Amoebophrya sp. A120]|eukprot:GSA120T00019469001.1
MATEQDKDAAPAEIANTTREYHPAGFPESQRRFVFRIWQWQLFLCNWELGALAVAIPTLERSSGNYFSNDNSDGLALSKSLYGFINMIYFFSAVAAYFVVSGLLLGNVPPQTLCT